MPVTMLTREICSQGTVKRKRSPVPLRSPGELLASLVATAQSVSLESAATEAVEFAQSIKRLKHNPDLIGTFLVCWWGYVQAARTKGKVLTAQVRSNLLWNAYRHAMRVSRRANGFSARGNSRKSCPAYVDVLDVMNIDSPLRQAVDDSERRRRVVETVGESQPNPDYLPFLPSNPDRQFNPRSLPGEVQRETVKAPAHNCGGASLEAWQARRRSQAVEQGRAVQSYLDDLSEVDLTVSGSSSDFPGADDQVDFASYGFGKRGYFTGGRSDIELYQSGRFHRAR